MFPPSDESSHIGKGLSSRKGLSFEGPIPFQLETNPLKHCQELSVHQEMNKLCRHPYFEWMVLVEYD